MSFSAKQNRQCCIGVHETSKQASINLEAFPLDNASSTRRTTTPWHLEQLMNKYLSHEPVNSNDEDEDSSEEDLLRKDPVKLFLSEDAHLLKCRRRRLTHSNNVINSIFGIWENTSLFVSKQKYISLLEHYDQQREEQDVEIHLQLFKPSSNFQHENAVQKYSCCCEHPKGNWNRHGNQNPKHDCDHDETKNSEKANVTILDLTSIQQQRRKQQYTQGEQTLSWNTPGRVCHLLRSILSSSHRASPWSRAYNDHNTSNNDNDSAGDNVVGILVNRGISDDDNDHNNDNQNEDFCSKLEQEELNEIIKFRTGDACPSYYLHSCSNIELQHDDNNDGDGNYSNAFFNDFASLVQNKENDGTASVNRGGDDLFLTQNDRSSQEREDEVKKTKHAALLIYRSIPPRDHLSPYPPPLSSTAEQNAENDAAQLKNKKSVTPDGCLWETYHVSVPSPPSQDESHHHQQQQQDEEEEEQVETRHRKVAPPYINVDEEYPGLMDHLLTPKNFAAVKEEALRIPQWTAWPERQHYRSTNSEEDEEDDKKENNSSSSSSSSSPYPASWTVFPLCHTFPATDISNRKFISSTCSFVPQTTALLQSLGPKLRTALFSRLDPQTVLSAHTGWEDLANHVLRVHIPLVVPKVNDDNDDNNNDGTAPGLCGTWVDGCVETHEEGRVICFDDSKTHRAFNYAKEERIVLIVDLERNVSSWSEEKGGDGNCVGLPIGTATGGHTEELDAFIDQLT